MNDIQHLAKLIKKTKFAMLTTMSDEEGHMQSRPMTLQQVEFDGDLWFFTDTTSTLAKQIKRHPRVNLAFSNIEDSDYVSVSGYADIRVDHAKAEELWNPLMKAWFPEGLEDPKLCLIKVQVESADYWETPSSKLVQLVGFAKAIVTGERAGTELGKHGHLNIN